MLQGLQDKIALITGASKGIGKAIMKRLYLEGVNITAVSRTSSTLSEAVSDLLQESQAYNSVITYNADVSDANSIRDLFDYIEEKLGIPTLLVNNVGGGRQRQEFTKIGVDMLEEAVILNLDSMLLVISEFAKRLICRGKPGAIVNLSSSAGLRPKAMRVQYGATKAGVNRLTLSLAKELAPYNIRVNSVCPGPTLTEDCKMRLQDPILSQIEFDRIKKIPMRRMAAMKEVAAAVAFLLSEEASYITGALLPVDGGYTLAV